MSSATSKRPGEIVSVEQMFNNLLFLFFLVSLDTFLLLLAEIESCISAGKAVLCPGQRL